MAPSPRQTPTVFLNAAAKETLDNPACRKALAACGYKPEDFGSYKDVRDQCDRAREKTKNAKTRGTRGKKNPDKDPTAHERWVAEGQSGHISENTRHQAKRGHNDTSFCPLYDTDEAPCMPHGGVAYHKDTQHGAVTNTDIANGNKANAGQEDEARADRKPIGAAGERKNTRDAMKAALDWGMKDGQPAAAEMRKKRFDAMAELTAKDKDLAAKKKKKAETDEAAAKKKYEANRKKALQCVEDFFNAQWRAMAKNTKDKKKRASDSSAADQKAAQAKIDALQEKRQTPQVKKDLAKARKDLQAAKDAPAEYKKVEKLKPNDIDKCMGQSRPPNSRTPFSKSTPTKKKREQDE